ncbi:GntR family transcriptional regulator [Ensifer sp. YR511]|uniref:GntR family transcriptional regulator n=1 Tax=Ensifer sp. YR511 TaxID=1855294 RepID=UPI000887500F|nr:GntR family transcriptional regulator [Ensifer sp. YR511]SDO22504.1 regulatory protein, gntR family [Ensifer sp. YR511]
MAASVEVFEILRKDIISGRYEPMHFFDAKALSAEYITSVAPIREAMLRLSERGVLRWERNRGFFVERISGAAALFYLEQLRSSYLYAIGRMVQCTDIRKFTQCDMEKRGSVLLCEYHNCLNMITRQVFSETEREFVGSTWDKIWFFRNAYLNDNETKEFLFDGVCNTIEHLAGGRLKECSVVVNQLFDHVIGKFPALLQRAGT